MAVCRKLGVLRLEKVKLFNYCGGAQIEIFVYKLFKLCVGYFARAEGINANRKRVSNADSVSKLKLAFVGKPRRNNVFRNISCGISGASVNLCRVFARKSSAAVARISAVGVNNYLSACKAAVARRTPITKLPVGLT